jgi:hypothetical protein
MTKSCEKLFSESCYFDGMKARKKYSDGRFTPLEKMTGDRLIARL